MSPRPEARPKRGEVYRINWIVGILLARVPVRAVIYKGMEWQLARKILL